MCGAALADGQETARRLHGLFGCARREALAMNELIMGAIIVGAVMGQSPWWRFSRSDGFNPADCPALRIGQATSVDGQSIAHFVMAITSPTQRLYQSP